MRLFGSSGIRQLVDEHLVDIVFKVARAVGTKYRRVIVGCDTRTSSALLKHIAIAGLCISGAKAFDAGLVPTPTLALTSRKFDCGLMITASHNPPQYNGVKLFNPDGSAFGPNQQKNIEDLVSDFSIQMEPWDKLGTCATYHGAIEQHINYIRRFFPQPYNLKVVVDCACGAASNVTPNLLQAMGCQILSLNSSPSGFFPHPAEPLEENLSDLIHAVRESGADFGVAHDGDADRMMAIDETGRYITGDRMLCLLADATHSKKLVTTVDASMIVDREGYEIIRTRVGDNHVSEELKTGGQFGGEPSGAWIFPKNTLCPDGIFAAACLVDIASKKKLSAQLESMVELPILRGSVPTGKIPFGQLESDIVASFKPAAINRTDGLKLTMSQGWILVRPSGTEPKIRFTIESSNDQWVKQVYETLAHLLHGGQ